MRFVIFADWASSLYGASIYDPANALNSNSFDTPGSTLSIEVRNIKNPMIGSTGWGIHTKIYSYTLRAEIAYAFENTEYYGSMFHLSLGYGF
jgi:hypothetical protein